MRYRGVCIALSTRPSVTAAPSSTRDCDATNVALTLLRGPYCLIAGATSHENSAADKGLGKIQPTRSAHPPPRTPLIASVIVKASPLSVKDSGHPHPDQALVVSRRGPPPNSVGRWCRGGA